MTSTASPRAPLCRDIRSLLILGTFVLLNTVPYCLRALHLDEFLYLTGALGVFKNPLFPQDFPLLWFGTENATGGFHSHPPFMTYILWSIIALTGSNREISLHLGFTIFPLVAAIATYYLARRFTGYPLWAALLIAATPACLVMSHTIMSDMAFQAFLLAGFACFIYGLDRDDHRRLALSSLCLTLACFTSYQGLLFVPVLLLYAWLTGKLKGRAVAYCLPPYLFFAAFMTVGFLHYNQFPPLGGKVWYQQYLFRQTILIDNAVGTITFLGGALLFPLATLLLADERRKLLGYFLAVPFAVGLAYHFASDYSLINKIIFIVLATNGLMLLIGFLRHTLRGLASPARRTVLPRRTEALFLGAWFVGVLLFYMVCADAVRARYMLCLIPPLLFTLINSMYEANERPLPKCPRRLVALWALTWLTATAVAISDYKFVGAYRQFTEYFDQTYHDFPYAKWGGVESGLRYYLEAVGVKTLSENDDSPRGLDLVVQPDKIFKYSLAQSLEAELSLVEQKSIPPATPLRTISFHDSKFYLLPYFFSRRVWDTINVYQVNVLVDQLPYATITGGLRERVYPTLWTLGRESKLTLRLPLRYRIQYPLRLPRDVAASFYLGVSPSASSSGRNRRGIFQVAAAYPGGGEAILHSRSISLETNGTAPLWDKVTIDAEKLAAPPIGLIFEALTEAEPENDEAVVGIANFIIAPKRVIAPGAP
ncbi:MAG: glycosyltransferase family 39 protein [Acidobacteria bacterium]|nr:glycosyltransferase family 39 protein [Acidobacteriota bacterium]